MKPVLLDPFNFQAPDCLDNIRQARLGEPGIVETDEIDTDLWDPIPFYKCLREHGYRRRESQHYDSLSLTFLNGSCGWHSDPGFGMIACWLIYSENTWNSEAELITASGPVPMREFDLCVFNADQGHAWLSNGVCVMVTATVSKICPKRQQSSNKSDV